MQPTLWAKARKAFRGAGIAMIGVIVVALKTELPKTEEGWVLLGSGVLGTGIAAWIGIYYATNEKVKPNTIGEAGVTI